MAKTTQHRSTFPVAPMKELALNVCDKTIYERKLSLKQEIISEYDRNEGRAVLDEIASLHFDPRELKSLKGVDKRQTNAKKILNGDNVTEDTIKKICKEFLYDYKQFASADVKQSANKLARDISDSAIETGTRINDCVAKKAEFERLHTQYVASRKPVLKEWRSLYRQLVDTQRKAIAENEKLQELKTLAKSQKGPDRKATTAERKLLEQQLRTEATQQLGDATAIAGLLNIEPLLAERYSRIFTRRREIDDLSAKSIRVAKLGEVLSLVAEKLTVALVDRARVSLFSSSKPDLKIELSDLQSQSVQKSTDPFIVFASCSKTMTSVDNHFSNSGSQIELDPRALKLATPVKNIINSKFKCKWDKNAKEAFYSIVYDSLVVIASMCRETVSGNAKTISRKGIEQVIHTYLGSHQVNTTLLDEDIDRIFRPRQSAKA